MFGETGARGCQKNVNSEIPLIDGVMKPGVGWKV